MRILLNILALLITIIFSTVDGSQILKNKQQNHRSQELTNSEIRYLAGLSNTRHIDDLLDNILIPRVVGTNEHEKVFEYIKKQLQNLNWHVDVDEFQSETPFGEFVFKNIIGVLNPDADRFLVLACHYDSKYFQDQDFVGATDSAVPCSMLLNMAKVMKSDLESLTGELGLKFIFFDGEEAFVDWGPTDSIYGARHLAEVYKSNSTKSRNIEEHADALQRIDILILLDLIGAKNPNFVSFHRNTEPWFVRFVDIEDKLHSLGLLKNHRHNYFKRRRSFGVIEDDHIPFLQRGVPIVHLITTPFPPEWHTAEDDRSIIDMDTVENINKILRVFVAEYLHLSVNN